MIFLDEMRCVFHEHSSRKWYCSVYLCVWKNIFEPNGTWLTKFCLHSINTRKRTRSQRASTLVSEACRMTPSWSTIWTWQSCSQTENTRKTTRTPKPVTIPLGIWSASLRQRWPRTWPPMSTTNNLCTTTHTCLMPWVSSTRGMLTKSRVM